MQEAPLGTPNEPQQSPESPEENTSQTEETRADGMASRENRLSMSGLAFSLGALFVVALSLMQPFLRNFIPEGASEPDWYIYILYLIPQLAFCGAAAVYFVRTKQPVKNFYRPTKPRFFLIAVLVQFGLLLSLSALNEYFIDLLGLMGYQSTPSPMPSNTTPNLFVSLFVIALLPAVFEELLFRGILTHGMQEAGWGIVPTVLISGALFSLYHGNPEQTVYQFICGAVFALITLRSGSILPSMTAHFVNNAAILILMRAGAEDFATFFPFGVYLALVIFSAVCLILGLVYLIVFEKRGNENKGTPRAKYFFVAAAGGIFVCAVEWIAALALGFV